MDATGSSMEGGDARMRLLQSLNMLGSAAFNPLNTYDTLTKAHQRDFENLIRKTRPAALLPALSFLIQPGHTPAWLRKEFTRQLALLPLRTDDGGGDDGDGSDGSRGTGAVSNGGVRATLEFVFSVHPSSNAADTAGATVPQKQGANITHEALQMATRLLSTPPERITADAWFAGIAPQLLALLDGRDGLELAKVAAYVIGFGILGRKSYGAPGTPGWTNFAEPMLRCIDPTTSRAPRQTVESGGDVVVDLRTKASTVLVSDDDVAQGLRRLQTLVLSHPNPGLTRRLLAPILLPLWALSSWPDASPRCKEDYCLPAENLLKIYLKITTSADKVLPIVRNLLFDGSRDASKEPQWAYQAKKTAGNTNTNSICIVTAPSGPLDAVEVLQTRWSEVGAKSDALLDLLASISTDDEDILSVFLDLFNRRISSAKSPTQKQGEKPEIVLPGIGDEAKDEQEEEDGSDAAGGSLLADVLEGSILQKMMEKFPEKLAGHPGRTLELVEGCLRQVDESALTEDETVSVLLSLLNLVVAAPGFRKAKADGTIMHSIEASLAKVANAAATETTTAKTAQNLLLFLTYRDEIEDPDTDAATASSDATRAASRHAEDRKTLNLALSYITQADSPPPVRSEGLNLLQSLIQANSAVLDIPALLVLLSSLLDENEDYVNLRVVKVFALLADRHPQSTTKELLDHYVDAAETKSVDARLRFGEALLQVVQRLGATFAGDTAQQVGQALLETAGRRGHRPKTAAKQARDERMRARARPNPGAGLGDRPGNNNKNDDDEDEDDVDLDDALLSKEEKQRNEILGRIVAGWGSTRGSEDVRIRASALSIFATGLDTNIAGLGAVLASGAVDLSLHVLTMEPEPEKAILRRAAIVTILSFVRALDAARQARRRLGFGLTPQSQDDILRILRYVAGTDEDGLVRQHAADVIESLENWQAISLLPAAAGNGGDDGGEGGSLLAAAGPMGGLTRLAGLSLNPLGQPEPAAQPSSSTSPPDANQTRRPRIEEIE
ncbi:protein required for cell viability [Niveomyces insectorum RCEF 264]|uniref:Protein required for cell viability n=1 Tax=Niveomyces insectorum RCEF 264 TaxID=1081102 RepID=A0A167QA99_9HYPO|nr:protein required for cell viability [Niveomyces insectorum RCEF 264]